MLTKIEHEFCEAERKVRDFCKRCRKCEARRQREGDIIVEQPNRHGQTTAAFMRAGGWA